MPFTADTILHYAMLIRLIGIVLIGAFGLSVALLVRWLRARLDRPRPVDVQISERRRA